jgi:pimeloyl-ACP methyl ester carboxylesterase
MDTMTHFKFYLFVTLVGVPVIGIVAVQAHYQRDIRAAREQLNNLGSQVIETDCGPIEYARVGDGYPVLVVHGALGGFDQGLFSTRNLIDAGYQVIAVSRFGYLRSPIPENATLDMQVDRFACLLDEMDIQQAAVLGLSSGATSAIRFTARYPERVSALILRVPAAPGTTMATPPPKIAFTMMRSDFVYWALVTYFKSLPQRLVGVPEGFTVPPESEPVLNGVIAATLPSSGRVDGFINDFSINSSALYEEVSETSPYSVYKIEVPVLLISVLDDPYAIAENVRNLAEKFPNARQLVLPDGGHIILGHSKELDAEEARFLQENVALVKNSQ